MKHRLTPITAACVVTLAAAALACGSVGNLADIGGTVEAAANELVPTLEAQAEEIGPTLEAQADELIAQATQHAPEIEATMTAVVATADAMGSTEFRGTAEALATYAAGTAAALFDGGGAVGDVPVFEGGDGYATIMVDSIGLDDPRTATLPAVSQAHNWLFTGSMYQTIRIDVVGIEGTDPRAKLLAPNGEILFYMDDINTTARNYDVSFTTSLPVDGIYTIRIDVFEPGDYTITVTEE